MARENNGSVNAFVILKTLSILLDANQENYIF